MDAETFGGVEEYHAAAPEDNRSIMVTRHISTPFRLSLVYIGVAVLWAMAAETLAALSYGRGLAEWLVEVAQWLAFLIASGWAIYALSARMVARHEAAEATLRETEARYRAVVEDQTEIICRFRPDGTITFVNEVFCRFFGQKAEDITGRCWQPKAVAEDLPRIEADLRQLTPANPVVSVENRVVAGDGRIRWMQFVNRALYDKAGNPTEIQSVGRDITARKEAEAALAASEARYRALFEDSPIAI